MCSSRAWSCHLYSTRLVSGNRWTEYETSCIWGRKTKKQNLGLVVEGTNSRTQKLATETSILSREGSLWWGNYLHFQKFVGRTEETEKCERALTAIIHILVCSDATPYNFERRSLSFRIHRYSVTEWIESDEFNGIPYKYPQIKEIRDSIKTRSPEWLWRFWISIKVRWLEKSA